MIQERKGVLVVPDRERFEPSEFIFPEGESVDIHAAEAVVDLVLSKPNAVLILPTGETPKGMYRKIAEVADNGQNVDFSGVTVFSLDEYFPIGRGNQESYTQYMEKYFYNHVNIPRGQRIIPDGQYPRFTLEAGRIQRKLDRLIESGIGIDLAVLGIGQNGHIGFNEPGSSFDSETRLVHLTDETIAANAIGFSDPDDVPSMAITIGLGENGIRSAQKILVLAKGSAKREALYRAFREEPTSDVPASVLQYHPGVTVVADYEAGELLAKS